MKYHVRIYGEDECTPLRQLRIYTESRHQAVELALHQYYSSHTPPRYIGGYCDCWEAHTTRDGHVRLWCYESHE